MERDFSRIMIRMSMHLRLSNGHRYVRTIHVDGHDTGITRHTATEKGKVIADEFHFGDDTLDGLKAKDGAEIYDWIMERFDVDPVATPEKGNENDETT